MMLLLSGYLLFCVGKCSLDHMLFLYLFLFLLHTIQCPALDAIKETSFNEIASTAIFFFVILWHAHAFYMLHHPQRMCVRVLRRFGLSFLYGKTTSQRKTWWKPNNQPTLIINVFTLEDKVKAMWQCTYPCICHMKKHSLLRSVRRPAYVCGI